MDSLAIGACRQPGTRDMKTPASLPEFSPVSRSTVHEKVYDRMLDQSHLSLPVYRVIARRKNQIITVSGKLTPEAAEALKTAWRKEHVKPAMRILS